jgi:tRNA 5-methylaminomethyl-2-thiouridine biosynthesis bifunctional protein
MHAKPSPYYLKLAALQWQRDDTPLATDFNDVYFQKDQPLEESEFVFLKNNQLQQRFAALTENKQQSFCIAETGFGTGLNFLASYKLWRQLAPSNCHLHFISTEKHPLRPADLRRALARWPQLQPLSDELLDSYPVLLPGHHRIDFNNNSVHLHLLLGDAVDALQGLRTSDLAIAGDTANFCVDAWFLDGFAPDKNPSLWNESLYRTMAQLSRDGTTVATITALSEVRRGLIAQGFAVKNEPGFNHSTMLCGRFERATATATEPANSPRKKGPRALWYVPAATPTVTDSERSAIVIGGGLAGTSTAYALANRGWRVNLIERSAELAKGASGNSQGMLYTKLSVDPGLLNHFNLNSYLYALRYYHNLQKHQLLNTEALNFCGMLQLANNTKQKKILHQLQAEFSQQPDLVQFLDPAQASAISGVAIEHPGCYFPGSGWLAPAALCQLWAQHPSITVSYDCAALSLRHEQQWQVLAENQHTLASAAVVVIANSYDANSFAQSQHLPLKTIRGQVTTLPTNPALSRLKTVVCHDGYITPAVAGVHNIGATFNPSAKNLDINDSDQATNIDRLLASIPSLAAGDSTLKQSPLQGRAGQRCMTPDYLPMVGPVPDRQAFIHDYGALRKDANTAIDSLGQYFPGLYINVAHGSRGLTSTPLCSELLAAQINQHLPPMSRDMIKGLNPARFIIRDLIRKKL